MNIARPGNRSKGRARLSLCLTLSMGLMTNADAQDGTVRNASPIEIADIESAGRLIGIDFDAKEAAQMLSKVRSSLRSFEGLRRRKLTNEVYPAFTFSPFLPGMTRRAATYVDPPSVVKVVERPESLESLWFADLETLGSLIRHRKVSCVELTKLFLARLRALDAKLAFVISYCDDRAIETAERLDAEIAKGEYRGPLHGIPYGAKDLLAARGAPTTWGAKPFEKQVFDFDATVVEKLEAAGAVLVCKTTLGALAWGDVWFGGTTKNPWNPKQGSSGSSAGSASAVAAGALPFAIGSETLGSIVSPSVRCGCSSLRPTFGRVARTGAMTLSWTMDKLGPICRSAKDASLVFAAIHGADGEDPTARDAPFSMPRQIDAKAVRVGVLRGRWIDTDDGKRFLAELRAAGFNPEPVSLPRFPTGPMMFTLQVEGAAAFDELTRSGRDDELVRQIQNAWPNVFRVARLVPAVEYLQANRLRVELMRAYDKAFEAFDVLVHPPFSGGVLGATNLTGHPTFVAPWASPPERGAPAAVCFTGQLDDEARLLALVAAWQSRTRYHEAHPELKAR